MIFRQVSILFTSSKWFRHIKDIVCDATCVVCRNVTATHESSVCADCFPLFVHAPLPSALQQRLAKHPDARDIRAFALFGLYPEAPFFEVLHAIKYHHTISLAYEMGVRLGKYLRVVAPAIDTIVPIPLHPARKRERGYNQAEIIARGVASQLNCEVATTVLKRRRNNITQTDLQHAQRQENVRNVFALTNKVYDIGESVLVVDDVMTTGATVLESVRTLRTRYVNTEFIIGVLATTGKQ